MKRILTGSIIVIAIILLITGAYVRFSFISSDKTSNKTSTTQPQPRASRTVSAIFKLPASGIIVSRDTKGKELLFKKGKWIRLEQLTTPGKYAWINKNTPSWNTKRKVCKSGPNTKDGAVHLMSCSGQDILIKATIR